MSAAAPIVCSRCLADVLSEQYVVRDDVWAAAATGGERLLCLGLAARYAYWVERPDRANPLLLL